MLSLVIPVYRNEASLDALLAAMEGLHRELGAELEIVFVVDGSPDRCYELLRERLPACPFGSQLVLLSRNFGSFSAIRQGLVVGTGSHFAVLAADLQEPPELAIQMYRTLRNEPCDVVVGTRESRDDPLFSRLASDLFWAVYRRYVMPEVPRGGVDIFACNRPFRDQLIALPEQHSSLISQIFWMGFRRKEVGYARRAREHGKSAWTLQKRLRYLADSVFAFTDLPIQLLIRLGAAGAVFSGALGLAVISARLAGLIPVPGYAALMLAVMFFGALNLLAIGVVGSYAWRAYENSKNRPIAIPLTHLRFPAATGPAASP